MGVLLTPQNHRSLVLVLRGTNKAAVLLYSDLVNRLLANLANWRTKLLAHLRPHVLEPTQSAVETGFFSEEQPDCVSKTQFLCLEVCNVYLLLFDLRPTVAQGDGAVEDKIIWGRGCINRKVAHAHELEFVASGGICQTGFDHGLNGYQ